MMAAMTLYLTMGRDAVVVAAKLAGHSNADSWPQEALVNFCGTLDRKYRNKYPRLKMNGWYADLLQEVKSKGTTTNRSEEHTSELKSLMRITYAVCCVKNKKISS